MNAPVTPLAVATKPEISDEVLVERVFKCDKCGAETKFSAKIERKFAGFFQKGSFKGLCKKCADKLAEEKKQQEKQSKSRYANRKGNQHKGRNDRSRRQRDKAQKAIAGGRNKRR